MAPAAPAESEAAAAVACYELPATGGASAPASADPECAECAGPHVLRRARVSEALVLATSPSCLCAPLGWAMHPPPSNSSACDGSGPATASAWALVDADSALFRLQLSKRSPNDAPPALSSATLIAGVLGGVVCLASGLMLFLHRRKTAKEKAKPKPVVITAVPKSSKSMDLGDRAIRRLRLSMDEPSSSASAGGLSSAIDADDITTLNAPEHVLKRDSALLPFHYDASQEVDPRPPKVHRSSSILLKAWAGGGGTKKEIPVESSYRHHRPPISGSSFSEPGSIGSARQSLQLRRPNEGLMNSPRLSSNLWRQSDMYHDTEAEVSRASLNFTRASLDQGPPGRPSIGLGRHSLSNDGPSRNFSSYVRPSHDVARTVGNLFGLHLNDGRGRRVDSRTRNNSGNILGASCTLEESVQAPTRTLETPNSELQQEGSEIHSLTLASTSRDSHVFSLSRVGLDSSSPTPSSVYMNLLEETGGLEK
ncbi:hypothetical protein HDU84_000305 [Entophlyctis sp. JEL0112]|nr:hypothetical protein HDU84_000305 [Entophlyctis sp. JEL0112]